MWLAGAKCWPPELEGWGVFGKAESECDVTIYLWKEV